MLELTERMPRVRIFTNIPASRSAPAPERPPPRPAFSLATHAFLPLVHFGVHAFPVLAELAPKTRHAALPVVEGTKFAANAWIHMFDYNEPNIWGCTGAFD